MHNTHTLWKTIHGLSNRAPPHTLNTSITFNNKIATTPKYIANTHLKHVTCTRQTPEPRVLLIHALTTTTPPPDPRPKHIANCFTKQFTNTIKQATYKTNRHINRATHNIQGYTITLTTSQVQEAINKVKITTHKVLTN